MWIFLSDSFLSIVDKGDASGKTLLVRARGKGEIERVFPDAQVTQGTGTDYRFRARIEREAVAQKLAAQIRGIDYSNFKSSVQEQKRHDSYMGVWQVMYRYQEHD